MFEQLPLRDIHLPEPVSWWPPAPGWWLLLALVAVVLAVMPMLRRSLARRRARRRLRQLALEELARVERELAATGDVAGALERTSVLLRRVALSVFPERRLAGRVGGEWAEWLRRTGPADLDPDMLDALSRAPYRPEPGVPGPSALAAARRWIVHVTGRPGRRDDGAEAAA